MPRNNHEIVTSFVRNPSKNAGKHYYRLCVVDNKLYSYGELIAEHSEDFKVRLYTSKRSKFSVTTTRHISLAWSTISKLGRDIVEA